MRDDALQKLSLRTLRAPIGQLTSEAWPSLLVDLATQRWSDRAIRVYAKIKESLGNRLNHTTTYNLIDPAPQCPLPIINGATPVQTLCPRVPLL